jgi:PhnB protein
MKSANPYLNLPGNTEEAFNFYRSVFGGEFSDVMRYRDFGDNTMGIPEKDLDKIAHIALPIGKDKLMATDAVESFPKKVVFGNNVYITVETDSPGEAERVFQALSDGGTVEMEIQKTEWAEKFGQCEDRYGVWWMIMYSET